MRPSVRVRSCTLASALVLCAGLAAAEDTVQPYPACNRTPTEGEVQAAKGAFQAGNGSFNEADYERAITYWEDAYRRDCTAHPLLLNLARAYELNGQKRHAVNALQTFVARNPGSPDEAQIQRRIEKLEEQIQAESAPAPQPTAQPASTPAPAPAPANAPPSEAAPAAGKRPMTPLIVAGVGGAIAIVGTLGWGGAMNDIKKAEDKCPVHDQCADPQVIKDGNDARSRANLFGAVAIVGLGTAIGGGVWYLVSKPKAAAASAPRGYVLASPSVAPGYGGISLAGAF